MGLTVSYSLKCRGSDPAEVLEALRQKALDMPFEEVSELYHFQGDSADYHSHDLDDCAWSLIQAQVYVDAGPGLTIGVSPEETYFFIAWPGKGCETASFGLARYPATISFSGREITTGIGGEWRWASFCKTQYASKVSLEHFLRCHISVCLLLKEAEKMGILEQVSDDSEFWDTWDIKALAEEVTEWNNAVLRVCKKLKDAFGENNVISSFDD